MSAAVETMFYHREKPWHGLGTMVMEAPESKEALRLAGLDWQVVQKPVMTDEGSLISGFKANVRDTDGEVLGIVTNRYKVVQNEEQQKNILRMKEDVLTRYRDAPDLQHVSKNAYRFVNAVSDFATHAKPLKERSNYRESLFARTVDGNALIDRAYELVNAA